MANHLNLRGGGLVDATDYGGNGAILVSLCSSKWLTWIVDLCTREAGGGREEVAVGGMGEKPLPEPLKCHDKLVVQLGQA